jgi:DNA primase
MHLQLYVAIGQSLVSDPAQATFRELVTRTPFEVFHDARDNGRMATYFARWSTRTGLTGPWSIPVGMTVVFVQRGG